MRKLDQAALDAARQKRERQEREKRERAARLAAAGAADERNRKRIAMAQRDIERRDARNTPVLPRRAAGYESTAAEKKDRQIEPLSRYAGGTSMPARPSVVGRPSQPDAGMPYMSANDFRQNIGRTQLDAFAGAIYNAAADAVNRRSGKDLYLSAGRKQLTDSLSQVEDNIAEMEEFYRQNGYYEDRMAYDGQVAARNSLQQELAENESRLGKAEMAYAELEQHRPVNVARKGLDQYLNSFTQYSETYPGYSGYNAENIYDAGLKSPETAEYTRSMMQQDAQNLPGTMRSLSDMIARFEQAGMGNTKEVANMRKQMEDLTRRSNMSLRDNADFRAVVDDAKANGYKPGDKHADILSAVLDPEAYEKKHFLVNLMPFSPYAGSKNAAKYMTDDERDTFVYLWQTQGEDAANQYFESLIPTGNQRYAETVEKGGEVIGEASPIAGLAVGTVGSVASAPANLFGLAETGINALAGEKTDPYGQNFAWNSARGGLQTGGKEAVIAPFLDENGGETAASKLAGLGYDVVSTSLDNVATALAYGPLAPVAMAASSASGATTDALIRSGGESTQSFLYGVGSGVAEWATEKIPMDQLGSMLAGGKKGIGAILAHSLTEAPGEMLSTILSEASDRAIMDAYSGYELSVQAMMQQGMSEEEARLNAEQDFWREVGYSGMLGWLSASGSGMVSQGIARMTGQGTAPEAQQPVQPVQQTNEAQQPVQPVQQTNEAQQPVQPVQQTPEAQQPVQQTAEDAQEAPSGSEAEQSAVQQAKPLQTVAEAVAERKMQQEAQQAPVQMEEAKGTMSAFATPQLGETVDGDTVQVVGIDQDGDGMPYLIVRDAIGDERSEPINAVNIADEAVQELLHADAARGMDSKTLTDMMSSYDGSVPADIYAQAYGYAYRRGSVNASFAEATPDTVREVLSQQAQMDAYTAGLDRYHSRQAQTVAQPAERTAVAVRQPASRGGVVRAYTRQAWAAMPKEQRRAAAAQIEVVGAIGRRVGRQIRIVDSITTADGQRVNGRYNTRTGEIEVALNADAGAYSYVAMHELTHDLKTNHADQWDGFGRVVTEALAANGVDVDAAIAYQQQAFGYDAETALEEVICNTAPAVLQNESVLKDLYTKDKTLFERVRDWVKNLIADIRKAGESLSQRSRSWQQMDALTGDADALQQIYDKMMAIYEAGTEAEIKQRAYAEMIPTEDDPGFSFSIRDEEPPVKTIKGYKVFAVFEKKPGELFPPMVANPGGASTPVGVWLNADAAPRAADSKTGRPKVQAGGKGTNTGKQTLAYRPGWHLGDSPRALQFNRKNPETGKKELFPYNFVWAECDVAADLDYQEEAMSYGYNANGNFQHSLAGLPRLPREDDGTAGYYRYRTNPNPDTVPWIISGAIKVNRILDDAETREILQKQKEQFVQSDEYLHMSPDDRVKALERFDYVPREGGDINLEAFGLTAGDVEQEKGHRYSMSDYNDDARAAEDHLGALMTMTAGHTLTDSEADRLAKRVINAVGSTLDRDTLAWRLKDALRSVQGLGRHEVAGALYAELMPVAQDVLDSSMRADTAHEERVKPLRKWLHEHPLALTKGQKAMAEEISGSYTAFKRQAKGVRMSLNGGNTLDTVYAKLTEFDPVAYPAEATEREKLAKLLDAGETVQKVYATGMGADESVRWMADKILNTYFTLTGVQRDAQNPTSFATALRNYRNAIGAYEKTSNDLFDEALGNVLERYGRKIERGEDFDLSKLVATDEGKELYRHVLSEKQRNLRRRIEDSLRRQQRTAQIYRQSRDLLKKLEKPTDKKHVQDALQGELTRFLKAINFGSANNTTRNLAARIRALRDVMSDQNRQDTSLPYLFDPDMAAQMRAMAARLEELPSMNELSDSELAELRQMIAYASHVVATADESFAEGRKLKISAVAGQSIDELQGRKNAKDREGWGEKLHNFLNVGQLDAFHFFDMLGNGGKKMFAALRKGLDRKIRHWAEATDYANDVIAALPKADRKDLFAGKKAPKTSFELANGTLNLSKAQIMELYCLSKRKNALLHLYEGGIRAGDGAKARSVLVTPAEVESITDTLTAAEKQVADKLQQYMATECGAWGNETSLQLYGYRKFGEADYYPMRVDPNSVDSGISEEGRNDNLYAILNMGMAKALQEGAHNALYIGDIFDTFAKHVDNMSKYNGFAAPVADLIRWYNYRAGGDQNIQYMLESKFGKAGRDYIPTLIRNLNGEKDRSYNPGLTSPFFSHMKAAAVGRNLRVVIQQPTAILRAGDMMDYKYIVAGMIDPQKPADRTRLKEAIELAKQYSPIAKLKSMGFFETDVGNSLRTAMFDDRTAMDKVKDEGMWLAGKMDEMTFGMLWRACEAETRALHPELTGEAFYEAVGQRLSDVIDYTQVVDTTLHRSQLMRSGNALSRMSATFMSEPTKTYNMLYSSLRRMLDNRTDPIAKKHFARTIGVFTLTGIVNAMAQSLIDAIRDDSDDEWWRKYLKHFFGDYSNLGEGWLQKLKNVAREASLEGNAGANLNVGTMIPYVKDVLSLMQGYDLNRTDMQSVEKLVQTAGQVGKLLTGDSTMSGWAWAKQIAGSVDSITGLGLGNALRDGYAVTNLLFGAMGKDSPISMRSEDATSTIAYDNLYKAMMSGNEASWRRLKSKMLANGKSEKDIHSAMAERLAADERISEAYGYKESGSSREVDRIRKAIIAELPGWMGEKQRIEIVDKAINGKKSVLTAAVKGDPRAEESYHLKQKEETAAEAERIMTELESLLPDSIPAGAKRSIVEEAVDSFAPDGDLNSKLYTYNDLTAVFAGLVNGTHTMEDYNLIISELVSDSTAADPGKTVQTNAKSKAKAAYIAAPAAARKRLGEVIKELFAMDDKDLQKWLD